MKEKKVLILFLARSVAKLLQFCLSQRYGYLAVWAKERDFLLLRRDFASAAVLVELCLVVKTLIGPITAGQEPASSILTLSFLNTAECLSSPAGKLTLLH